jgi:hypothetical protein
MRGDVIPTPNLPNHPSHDLRVRNDHTALGHHRNEISVVQPIGDVPAHAQNNDLGVENSLLATPAVTKQSEQRDSQLCTGQLDLLLGRQFVLLPDAPGGGICGSRSTRLCHVEITEVLAAVGGMSISDERINAAVVRQRDARCAERERRCHYKLLAP